MKKLWRKLFPVRIKFVAQYHDPDLDVSGGIKDLFPELVNSQSKSPEIFAWAYIRLRDLELRLHKRPLKPTKEAMEEFAFEQYAITAEIEQIKDLIKLPALAAKVLAERKVKTEEIESDEYTNWGE